MSSRVTHGRLMVAALCLAASVPAEAQAPLGVRASGMAGAFVGVADDASGVYWNPAGLATGSYVSFILDYGWDEASPDGALAPAGGQRGTAGIVAFSVPPLGISYYRLGLFVAGPREAEASGAPDREDVRRSVQAVTTSVLGTTLLQSVGEYVVVGATVKLVRGEVARGRVGAFGADEALDQAEMLPRRGTTTGDVDLGAMFALDHLRVGVVARNLTTPSFALDESGTERVELAREVRIGAGWGSGWPGISRLVLALDGDVTSRSTASGDRRDLAAGVETWWLNQRLGVRGGVRASTLGRSRSVGAVGVSAGVTSGFFLEAHAALGQADERSWSAGARVTF